MLALHAAPPAPAPVLPAEIGAPLGHFGNSVAEPPTGGTSDADRSVVLGWPNCEPRAVYLMRFLGGATRAVEQFQQSLDHGTGSEKKLFGARKAVLTEVAKGLAAAKFEPKVACDAPVLLDGFKLTLTAAPKKWCPAKADATTGDFWFFAAGKPVMVVQISRGAEGSSCQPRLSAVLFDAKAAPRIRMHADWAGELSATLVGEKCQDVEYPFDKEKQAFVPTWKPCKR